MGIWGLGIGGWGMGDGGWGMGDGGLGNYSIGEQVIKELTQAAKGKTLIAVTHDERLRPYFDCVIDMNDITGSPYDVAQGKAVE